MISQVRRAALSVHLNIAEGCSRKSEVERGRFYEIARGSINEVDAALDVANKLGYLNDFDATELGDTMNRAYQMISRMIKPQSQT